MADKRYERRPGRLFDLLAGHSWPDPDRLIHGL
jgi:hypothetical protein